MYLIAAKEKRSAILHPRTGGGKKPSSPNLSEQLLLDNLEGRPSLCGLPCGIDTASGKYTYMYISFMIHASDS